MESSYLKNIQVTVHERKWMKAGKCWRVTLRLPKGDEALAPLLSGVIGTQVRAELRGEADVDIDPAVILDVPQNGKRFFLQIENVYENQNGIGPGLTRLAEQETCLLTMVPTGEERKHEPDPVRGDVQEKTLRGLHAAFFQNRLFWEFIERQSGTIIDSPEACKAEFKRLAGVDSCRGLSEAFVREKVRQFNDFINQGRRG